MSHVFIPSKMLIVLLAIGGLKKRKWPEKLEINYFFLLLFFVQLPALIYVYMQN